MYLNIPHPDVIKFRCFRDRHTIYYIREIRLPYQSKKQNSLGDIKTYCKVCCIFLLSGFNHITECTIKEVILFFIKLTKFLVVVTPTLPLLLLPITF